MLSLLFGCPLLLFEQCAGPCGLGKLALAAMVLVNEQAADRGEDGDQGSSC